MVQSVPAEKVINAVPFTHGSGKQRGGQVQSQAVGISAVQKFVSDKGAETIWDEGGLPELCGGAGRGFLLSGMDGGMHSLWRLR